MRLSLSATCAERPRALCRPPSRTLPLLAAATSVAVLCAVGGTFAPSRCHGLTSTPQALVYLLPAFSPQVLVDAMAKSARALALAQPAALF